MTLFTLRKSLLIACLVLCAGLFISSSLLFHYYHGGHLPRYPQPTVGRVYPSSNHGSIVYLTRSEHNLLVALRLSGLIPFFVGFILNKKWRVFVDPLESLSPEQRYEILHGRDKPI